MNILSLVLLCVVSIIHVIACGRGNLPVRRISKIFLMPLVSFVYLSWTETILWPVLVAMFMGWVGDIFLIFPSHKNLQTMGILSFGVGHIFYIVAMHNFFNRLPFYMYIVVVIVVLAASALAYSRSTKIIPKDMRLASIAYYLLLTLIATGSGFILATGQLCAIPMLLGSWLFLISDTILVIQFYSVGDDNNKQSVKVMTTYILAQALLCTGFILAVA